MKLVQASMPFTFNYTAYDLNAGLFIGFRVYDVSSGTPVLLTTVHGALANFGAYVGNYTPLANKTYMIIGLVFTDGTYATVDGTRAPSLAFYQTISASVTYLPFGYAAFNLEIDLNLRGTVFDMNSGSPVFVSNVSMVEVENGIYFGHFTGTAGHPYQIASVVYTNNSFSTVDTSWAPACEDYECISTASVNVTNIIRVPTLTGQSLDAVLTGVC